MLENVRVFLSYSHDSDRHKAAVLALANRLRADGLESRIDQYVPFPPEGWPRWMAAEIAAAHFVLVVCTSTYCSRAEGRETAGRGRGASWEGMLITQELYEHAGRNSKFVPVVLTSADLPHIPAFLAPATRFNLAADADYENLLRLLTRQPAVLMPPVSPVRLLPPVVGTASISGVIGSGSEAVVFRETEAPVLIWRMPRGFVLLEDLSNPGYDSWATIATHYDYRGRPNQGTHYHDSYRWSERDKSLDMQLRKLWIPLGDDRFARPALSLMMDVREGRTIIEPNGDISGRVTLTRDARCTVIRPGSMVLPTMLAEDFALAMSGPLRDLIEEAEEAIRRLRHPEGDGIGGHEDLTLAIARIRREVRLEAHRLLASSHPAFKNLEEIVGRYVGSGPSREQIRWLKEFTQAIRETVGCVERAGE